MLAAKHACMSVLTAAEDAWTLQGVEALSRMHSYAFCVSAVPWAAAHDAGGDTDAVSVLAESSTQCKPAGPWCAWCGAQATHESLGPVRAREGRASASTRPQMQFPLSSPGGPWGGSGWEIAQKSMCPDLPETPARTCSQYPPSGAAVSGPQTHFLGTFSPVPFCANSG